MKYQSSRFLQRGTRVVMGFSIIEVVVAMAIIGILALIFVPVVARRTEEARLRACDSDLEHLAAAEERAATDTGYMYRLYVLDDVIGGDGITNTMPSLDRIDGLRDENLAAAAGRVGFGTNFFINTSTEDFDINNATIFQRMTDTRVTQYPESAFGWNGPYINWHVLRDVNDNDWPDDPWGNDYLFFTAVGGISSVETQFQIAQITMPDGRVLRDAAGIARWTDRPTILSLGPNGQPGDGTGVAPGGNWGQGDDKYRKF